MGVELGTTLAGGRLKQKTRSDYKLRPLSSHGFKDNPKEEF